MQIARTAVAAVVAALLASGCGGSDGEQAPSPSESPLPPPTTPSVPVTDEPTSEPTTTGQGVDADQAVAVVREWLSALETGDLDRATELTGGYSRENVERAGGLEAMASGLAEGMSAFGRAKDATWDAVGVPSQDDAWLVVVEGEVTREGTTERDARSWLVHPDGDRPAVVEWFTPVPAEQVSPPVAVRELAPSAAVEVLLPADGSTTVLLDAEPVTDGVSEEGEDGDRVRVVVRPRQGWPVGDHVVVVAVVPPNAGGDAPWGSVAVPVTVAG